MDFFNGALFRSMAITLSSLCILRANNYQDNKKITFLIIGFIISVIYVISFSISYWNSESEILLYNSYIYKGYIYKSNINDNKKLIFTDQLVVCALYLSIYIGLSILITNPATINNIPLKIDKVLIFILILILYKFVLSILIDDSWDKPSFNTIQSYVYSGIIVFIVPVVSFIYYWLQKDNIAQDVILQNILQNIFKILMAVTSIYLILSPLVNSFNDVECSYFSEQNCKDQSCSYDEDKGECKELDTPGPPPAPPPESPSPCNSYNDESSCNKGNNCYSVKNRDDISDLTTDKFNGCINKDEKCTGGYDSPCSDTFEPTNRFKECCYDTIFNDSNCIESEMISRMNNDQIVNTRKRENETDKGRVGDYGLESGEKQIEYEAIRGYCYESNIRKDMEADIYA